MPDKNIVDDYYSSQKVENTPETPQNVEKKHKVALKGKIKSKKEAEAPKVETHTPEVAKTTDSKKVEKESVVLSTPKNTFKPPFERIPKVETPKPSYQKNDGNRPERKNNFQNNRSNERPFVKKPNDGAPQNQEKKEGGFKTEKPTFSFDKKPAKDLAKKTKKPFETKEQEEARKAKMFKKDKSTKHQKNYFEEEEDTSFSRSKMKKHEKVEKKVEDIKQNLVNRTGETVIIGDVLSVKELSEKIGVPLMKLITEFMKNGMRVTLNSKIDFDTAAIIAETFEIKLQKDISSGFDVSDILEGNIQALIQETDPSVFVTRPPVVSIMGHVDHGKTSLLDHIRKTKIADKEAGGITQSIGAYQVVVNEKKITFLDTPGHEAFTIMRARGAKSTDIAILVVAADEWVKPQTIESINHAREAGIPVVVAINKMDKEGANPDFVKGQLAGYGLQPEDWGGDTPMVPVSAKAGTGIDDLLEIILIVAEMQALKANPKRQAVGTVIESHLDTKLGPVSTILINTGTLQKWDSLVCKWAYGKVKVLKDYIGKNISEADPSMPVLVVWLDSVCEWGDIVQVVSDIEKARVKALEYKELVLSKKASSSSSIDLIMSKIKSGNLKQLKVVLKSDTNGSLEALKGALLKLSTEETKVTIIHSWVGNVTEGDILMCQGSNAILVGFNVNLLGNTQSMIENNKIEYISSKVIYHVTDRVEKIITGMLDPKEVETVLGEAVIGGIFYADKDFMILWLKLKAEGYIQAKAQVRIIRKDKYIGKGTIENLKSWVMDVDKLEGPIECGIKLKTDAKVEMGDMLEIFKIEIQK